MRYTIQVAGRAILLGGVAQLGERSVRNAEVASSNLVVSTVWTVFGLSGAVLFDRIKLPGAGLRSAMLAGPRRKRGRERQRAAGCREEI